MNVLIKVALPVLLASSLLSGCATHSDGRKIGSHSSVLACTRMWRSSTGSPVICGAAMPHLLVAGTTGSGKSVAVNAMILSLIYKSEPRQVRLILIDPKMLELSVYDGIPHLLAPVVTDPKKAVVALKWTVREMEDRYRKMSKVGVRNIDGFNARVVEAKARGETITRTVQTGFDRETGEAIYEDEVMELDALPYIVVIVDEVLRPHRTRHNEVVSHTETPILRYDVRQPNATFDDPTRADLTREVKQVLSFSACAPQRWCRSTPRALRPTW